MPDPRNSNGERLSDQRLIQAFSRLQPHAFGASCGILGAVGLFLVTAILLLKGPATPPGLMTLPKRMPPASRAQSQPAASPSRQQASIASKVSPSGGNVSSRKSWSAASTGLSPMAPTIRATSTSKFA